MYQRYQKSLTFQMIQTFLTFQMSLRFLRILLLPEALEGL